MRRDNKRGVMKKKTCSKARLEPQATQIPARCHTSWSNLKRCMCISHIVMDDSVSMLGNCFMERYVYVVKIRITYTNVTVFKIGFLKYKLNTGLLSNTLRNYTKKEK